LIYSNFKTSLSRQNLKEQALDLPMSTVLF